MAQGQQGEDLKVIASLLDTHYWLWLQTGHAGRLSSQARNELLTLQRNSLLYLSAVSVWEVARLVADGDMDIGMSIDRFLQEATVDGGLQLLPLTTQILIESTRLPGNIHRDPSDRILVATAREHGLTLLTRDRDLLAYGRKGHLSVLKL
jgi:PIN domain nuclease of toxin-antitoxin system